MRDSVLLDTSFFIRLLNSDDKLSLNAEDYFRYFIEKEMSMFISTISIAEFCVKGNIDDLPLASVRILPFNLNHAIRTGQFAEIIFREKDRLRLNDRNIIPNDTKIFAQADRETSIKYYLSSDAESMKIYEILKQETPPCFQFIDLKDPHTKTFQLLF
jgi:predicted nucleic acid-binding protein